MTTLKIGPIELNDGAFLAPMLGSTNPPYRQLCREMGAALCVTELVPSDELCGHPADVGQLVPRIQGESPFAVQLYGRDPQNMAEAARIVASAGADIIDLNFGCPARKVVLGGKGAGVALMREPELLGQIASAVVGAVDLPVTAKIRIGWSKQERNAPYVAGILEDVGIQALCVHARWRNQVHSGPVDLDTLAEVVASVNLPVIGNGGIRTRSDAKRMIKRTSCDRVAVGTAAAENPWIFQKLAGHSTPPSRSERARVCARHLELFAQWAGEQAALREMRKHVRWYFKPLESADELFEQFDSAESLEELRILLEQVQR